MWAEVIEVRIAIGSDHAGLALKQELVRWLGEAGYECQDFGTHSTASCDYPDFARAVGEAVASGEFERGILVCGTGIGVSITANKVPGVRAAVCLDTFSARMSREHNDANVLCLGSRVVGVGLAQDLADIWLRTPFSGDERHSRRIRKIAEVEQAACAR
ncbi:MAG: ribose 5-phosphate isomerase B [Chloroflexi bacterium]|nr:ribose 5-phosphate isomerase B [Chloroflexota bacterium]